MMSVGGIGPRMAGCVGGAMAVPTASSMRVRVHAEGIPEYLYVE